MSEENRPKDYPAILRAARTLSGLTQLQFVRQHGLQSLSELERLATPPADPERLRRWVIGKYGVENSASPTRYQNLFSVASGIDDPKILEIFLEVNDIESMAALKHLAEAGAPIDIERIESAVMKAGGGRPSYKFDKV